MGTYTIKNMSTIKDRVILNIVGMFLDGDVRSANAEARRLHIEIKIKKDEFGDYVSFRAVDRYEGKARK